MMAHSDWLINLPRVAGNSLYGQLISNREGISGGTQQFAQSKNLKVVQISAIQLEMYCRGKKIRHEIFRVVSRFPRNISCYISESRLPLGQCVSTVKIICFYLTREKSPAGREYT